MALIVGGYLNLNEALPFPGWRAAIPTVGCALVIASPRSDVGKLALGNPVAGFFGLISYPLYLWHWPLFAFAHTWPGVIPTPCGAVRPRRGGGRARRAHLPLRRAACGGGLPPPALRARPRARGGSGRNRNPRPRDLRIEGLSGPVSAHGDARFRFQRQRRGRRAPADGLRYQRDDRAYPLDEERRRVADFFESHRCGVPRDPAKPTILVVGDSHATHLFAGLDRTYGDRANVMALAAVFCVPLVERVAMDQGVAGTPRCRAINDYVFRRIREIRPDVLVVGGYYAQYDHEANWRYPGFLDAMVAGARTLHDDGVSSIVIAGESPTWAPVLPILVGRDLLETGSAL